MIDYSLNNSYVDSVHLNNTYGQCVDNDMFIAKRLRNTIGQAGYVGPTLATSTAQTDKLPDGAKIFSDAKDFRIMQKCVLSMQDSLHRCSSSLVSTVNFIEPISQSTAIVCTPLATYVVTSDDIIGNEGQFSPSTLVKDEYGRNVVVTAVLRHGKYANELFAAKTSESGTIGIYSIYMTGYSMSSKGYAFRLMQRFNEDIIAISYDEHNNLLFCASSSTLYECNVKHDYLQGYVVSSVEAIATFNDAIGTGSICAIQAADEIVLVLTSNGSIYHVGEFDSSGIGFYSPSISQISQDDIVVYDIATLGNEQYFATSTGLCKLVDGKLQVVDNRHQEPISYFKIDSNGVMWLVCVDEQAAHSKILRSTGTYVEEYCTVDAHIHDFHIICGIKFITTDDDLLYESTKYSFVPSGISADFIASKAIVMSQFGNEADAYVAGKNVSTQSLATAKLHFSRNTDDIDNNYIESISVLSSFGNDNSTEVVSMIQLNGQCYAFVNNGNSSLMYDVNNKRRAYRWNAPVRGAIKHANGRYAYILFDNAAYLIDSTKATTLSTMTFELSSFKLVDSQCISGTCQWIWNDGIFRTPSYNDGVWTISVGSQELTCNGRSDDIRLQFYSDDETIVGQLQVQYLLTLHKSTDDGEQSYLYRATLRNDAIQLKESIALNADSNVVQYEDVYLAMSSNGQDLSAQAFELTTQMSKYDANINESLSTQIDMHSPQIVDNIFLPISSDDDNDSLLKYVRSDYVVPGYGHNLSVLRSICTYDKEISAFAIDSDQQSLIEVPDTSNIVKIDHKYCIDNTHSYYQSEGEDTIGYIISNDSTISVVYNMKNLTNTIADLSNSYIDNPSYDFMLHQHIISNDNVYDTAIVRCVSNSSINTKSFIAIEKHKTQLSTFIYNGGGSTNNKTKFKPISLSTLDSYDTLYLCKSSLDNVYALVSCNSNDSSQYYVAQLSVYNDNNQLICADVSCVMLYNVQTNQTPDALFFTYNDSDSYQPYTDTYRNQMSPRVIDQNSGGTLHAVFGNEDHVFKFDAGNSLTSGYEVLQWLDEYDVKSAMSLHQTPDTFENDMFATAIFGNKDLSALFYLSDKRGLYQLDNEKTIYHTDVPNAMKQLTWIGKDIDLDRTLLMKGNNLSVCSSNTYELSVQLPANSDNIHLLQCYGQAFDDRQNILYSTYANGKQTTFISSIVDGNIVSSQQLMQSTSNNIIDVLNISNDNLYPYIAYSSNLATIKYYDVANVDISVVEDSILSTTESKISVQSFMLDARNAMSMYIVNSPRYSPVMLYNATYDEEQQISSVTNYNRLTSLRFPNNLVNLADGIANGEYQGNPAIAMIDKTRDSFQLLDSNSYLESLMKNAKLGAMQYLDETYALYGAIPGYGAFKLNFTKFDKTNNFSKSNAQIQYDEYASSILPISTDAYAIRTMSRIYEYQASQQQLQQQYYSENAQIGMLEFEEDDGIKTYYTAFGNSILSSRSLSSWDIVLSAGKDILSNTAIVDFMHLTPYVSLISKKNSSDQGLFYTSYMYELVENTLQFSPESAYYMYYDNASEIDEYNYNLMQQHIQDNHMSGSDMALINSCMERSFELSGFFKANSSYDMSNDYIDRMLAGNSSDGNVRAYATNSAVAGKWKSINCSYIAKCWKSGLVELYIYLPTTHTYYIPHIPGASQCIGDSDVVKANNKSLSISVQDNATIIRINVASNCFTIGTMLENTIKPNSLPLQIYKTAENVLGAGSLFHTFVCPSIAQEFDSEYNAFGYYELKYYCFGSDAQAIKVSFIDPQPMYGKKHKSITYHANGGYMAMFPDMTTITQNVYADGDAIPMYWDVFQKNGSFFAGWSQSPIAVDVDPKYYDGKKVSYDSMDYITLNLYACWITYEFSENDTQITITNTVPKDYTIAEITIDPNASIHNNQNLGNKLIVDYDN